MRTADAVKNHRKPPLPESMRVSTPGLCRWCGHPVLNGKGELIKRKRIWHPACVKEFKLLHWPAETRYAVWARDHGFCARCGIDTEATIRQRYGARLGTHMPHGTGRLWQHDHIRPLVEANGNLDFWRLDNIQTLCHPCHVAKGKEDNARRKKLRTAGSLTQCALTF